jgi:apolipoprotein N-acyltransferase
MALPFAAAILVKRRHGVSWGLTALGAFTLLQEAFWNHGPLAMPSALFGHTLAEHPYLNQPADLAGVPGLSLWVLMMNLLLLFALERPPASGGRIRIRPAPLAGAGVLLLASLAYSTWRLHPRIEPSEHAITALLLQPAPQPDAWASLDDGPRLQRLLAATDSALSRIAPPPDLLIWPETAIPASPAGIPQETYWLPVQQWVDETGLPLLAGAISRVPEAPDPSVAFANSALLFTPTRPMQAYHKNRLVPFAERVPFESFYRGLSLLRVDAGGVGGYQAGASRPLLVSGSLEMGVLICFETLFGDYSRRYVRDGAPILNALSNIGWWGPSPAPAQYLAFTRLRAIETRRSLIVSTVTGPSALIEPSGTLHSLSNWMEEDAVLVKAPLRHETTLYTRLGDWISLLALLASIGFVAACFFPRSKTAATFSQKS